MVTANVASGATTFIPIYPAIVPPVGGQPVQYQTVTASPASGSRGESGASESSARPQSTEEELLLLLSRPASHPRDGGYGDSRWSA